MVNASSKKLWQIVVLAAINWVAITLWTIAWLQVRTRTLLIIETLDEDTISAADYTIVARGVPFDATDPDEVGPFSNPIPVMPVAYGNPACRVCLLLDGCPHNTFSLYMFARSVPYILLQARRGSRRGYRPQ